MLCRIVRQGGLHPGACRRRWCVLIGGMVALLAAPASGQPYLGANAGVTWSGLGGTFFDGTGRELGAVLGVSAEYVVSGWGFDVELNMIQKGGDDLRVPTDTGAIDFKYSFLEIPVLVHRVFRLGVSRRTTLEPQVGGAVAFAGGCGIRRSGGQSFDDCADDGPGGRTNGLEVSLLAGLAYRRWYPGRSWIAFEVRFSQGLTTVPESARAVNLSGLTNVLQFLFSFGLPLSSWP